MAPGPALLSPAPGARDAGGPGPGGRPEWRSRAALAPPEGAARPRGTKTPGCLQRGAVWGSVFCPERSPSLCPRGKHSFLVLIPYLVVPYPDEKTQPWPSSLTRAITTVLINWLLKSFSGLCVCLPVKSWNEEFNPLKINYGDTLKVDYPTGSNQPALTPLHNSP